MFCERNDDVTYYALFIACIAACEKLSRHELAVASMQRALRKGNSFAFWKRRSESVGDWCYRKGIPVGLLPVWQRHLEVQAKSFRPVPRSIDAASVQILSNATLTLTVVCDVAVSSHLSTLNFIFYSIKITMATGRFINIDKLASD